VAGRTTAANWLADGADVVGACRPPVSAGFEKDERNAGERATASTVFPTPATQRRGRRLIWPLSLNASTTAGRRTVPRTGRE